MKLVCPLLLLCATYGCSRNDGAATAPWLDSLLDAGQRFAAGHDLTLPSRSAIDQRLDALEESAREAMEAGRDPHHAIAEAIFETHGYQREVDDVRPQQMFLATTLAGGRGSCLGLVQLTVVLGERLAIPLRPMVAPGHVFVADTSTDEPVYWEMLRQGEIMPASWYRERYGVPSKVTAYLRPLDREELVGLLAYNLGNEDRVRRKLGRAAMRYREATELFPTFPEAHASAGLVHHLLGDLDAAERAYREARRLHPELAGLDDNLGLLAREQLWRWATSHLPR